MLIGRRRERDVLEQCLDDVRQSGVPSLFLTGEAGIGKTTLLAALRTMAKALGHRVASVVATDDARTGPLRPWLTVLDQLGQDTTALERSVTGIDTLTADHQARAQRAVLAAIRDAASVRPVVITLDDLQWMDHPSRDALLHVVRGTASSPVLLAGAWHTPVSHRDAAFQAFVANLYREPGIRWLKLSGLDEAEVNELAAALGWSPSPAASRALLARTNGNPFYVTEIARAAEGDIPASIRSVVQRQCDSLGEAARRVLAVASIFPHDVDFAMLGEMTGLTDDTLLDAVDEALAEGLMRPVDGEPERYAFVHDVVREAIAAEWSPSRRARLHRKAAETLERRHAGQEESVAAELAAHYHASRSLPAAERGITHALAGASVASTASRFGEAVELLHIGRTLAAGEPAATRAGIEAKLALALAEAVRVDEAEAAAERAVALLEEAAAPPQEIAHACWRLAHTLNAFGASAGVRARLREAGVRALGDRRDIHWARLRLLEDPIDVMHNDVLYVARWAGFDPEAQRIALASEREEDQVQTIESFDPRTPGETRALIERARSWRHERATLRGLTAAANDLTYRHGEFRAAIDLWRDVLAIARRAGAIPWQANALNQVTLLHVTLGEFELAVRSKYEADAVNALLGPANDTEVLAMERDFALTHYLDGDWPGQAAYWLRFASEPPQGLEARLAGPLYAAMAASAAASAGVATGRVRRLVDELASIATLPGIQQANGVVGWAGDAIARIRDGERAATIDRLAADLLAGGVGDYPQTSLLLTRARMLALLGDDRAQALFDEARETLALQGQAPLLGIAAYEQATAAGTPAVSRQRLLDEAIARFQALGMTSWHERAQAALASPPVTQRDMAGISRRELDVLRLVARGYSDRRVADELYISERTVNAHMRSILQKSGAENRTGLSVWARERGILDA